MATTTFATGNALTQKVWAKKLFVEAPNATPVAPLIGTSSDSIIQRKVELEKGSGDKVTVGLRVQLAGKGVSSSGTLEGNEEALTTYSDAFVIDELAHAVRVRNPSRSIDAKRVAFNPRTEAKDGLRDWYAKRLSVTVFNQLCGYTPANTEAATSGLVYTGLNAVVAPSSDRILRPAAVAADQSLTTSHKFTLSLIDYAKELAQTAATPIRPIMIDGEEKYVIYLHDYQVTDLRTDAATAGNWFDIQKAALQGGKSSKSPIYTGALGEHNGVIIHKAVDVTPGVSGVDGTSVANVRRAVFLGAQAGMMSFGPDTGPDSYAWEEEEFGYARELGVSVQALFGMKKTTFNSKDFGTIVIPTYAVKHAG